MEKIEKQIEMRNRTSTWFETKIRYEKTTEDGLQKKVTEQYVVDALSFSEAETKITEEIQAYISGDFAVQAIKRASFKEVFFSDNDADDRWFKAKLQFITINERTEKETHSNMLYLVQAANIDVARKYIKDVMDSTIIDYDIVQLLETPFIDVYEHCQNISDND